MLSIGGSNVMMDKLTDNEMNNLIFALIKYGFGKIVPDIKDPPNKLIYSIMLDVKQDVVNVPNIIDNTLRVVEITYNVFLSDQDFERLKNYCYTISAEIMKQPFETRNSLGKDSDSNDFITLH